MTSSLKGEYKKLEKKFSLPSYEKVDKEFELDTLDEQPNVLRYVRKRVCDLLDHYAKLLEDLMHPESSISALYELKSMEDDYKEKMLTSYKKLMMLLRYGLEVSLKNEESADAKFISQSFDEWTALKPDMLKLAAQLKSGWENDKDIKEHLEYFG